MLLPARTVSSFRPRSFSRTTLWSWVTSSCCLALAGGRRARGDGFGLGREEEVAVAAWRR